MPIYEFECRNCHKRIEVLVKPGEQDISCPLCGKKDLTRLLSAFSAPDGGGGHQHASGGCSCCPSRPRCPRSDGDV